MPRRASGQQNQVESGLDRLVLINCYLDISVTEELFEKYVFVFQVYRRGIIAYNPTMGCLPSGFLVEHAAHILEKNGWLIVIVCVQSGQQITNLPRDVQITGMDVFL